MLRPFFFTAIIAVALANCARPPAPALDAGCRYVMSPEGQPLRFCENGANLTIDTTPALPAAPAATAAAKRLIDDPEFLAAMIAQQPKARRPQKSIDGPLCVADTPGYITISTRDFAAMVARGAPLAAPTDRISAAAPYSNATTATPD